MIATVSIPPAMGNGSATLTPPTILPRWGRFARHAAPPAHDASDRRKQGTWVMALVPTASAADSHWQVSTPPDLLERLLIAFARSDVEKLDPGEGDAERSWEGVRSDFASESTEFECQYRFTEYEYEYDFKIPDKHRLVNQTPSGGDSSGYFSKAVLMAQCLISFGANLGARESSVATSCRQLAAMTKVSQFRVSRLFRSPPIGGPEGQEPFVNGVAAFNTEASAQEVLHWLQALEQQLGRKRDHRWAARRIDLDVVLHGNLVGGSSQLTVPHPRYTARRFVLLPACDVAAEYRDPRFGWTLRELTDHIQTASPSMALVGGDQETREAICNRLHQRFNVQTFTDVTVSRPEDALYRQPWIASFVDPLPPATAEPPDRVPRLLARLQWTQPQHRWPAPHHLWPSSIRWPEYRLEMNDLDWAASELAAALESMRCPIEPLSDDGDWWR